MLGPDGWCAKNVWHGLQKDKILAKKDELRGLILLTVFCYPDATLDQLKGVTISFGEFCCFNQIVLKNNKTTNDSLFLIEQFGQS